MQRSDHSPARRQLLALIGAAAVSVALPVAAQDARTIEVQKAARDWLVLTDKLDGAASWNAASPKFRSAIDQGPWGAALQGVRTPFGALRSREFLGSQFARQIPGQPDGDYALVEFKTAFEKKPEGRETVTLERSAQGQWQVIGYFVQ